MDARKDERHTRLSRGMQQRVSLSRVLVNDPQLLLLDEPASGLDPRARIELMEILRELRNLGKTIFISSHILSELGNLCDGITIIDRGRTRYSGPIDGLGSGDENRRTFRLVLEEPRPELEAALRDIDGVAEVTPEPGRPQYRVVIDPNRAGANELLRATLDCGGKVTAFQRDDAELNQAFLALTQPGIST
jgi:ABC-2 type transport system ATP-binding protein